MALDTYTGSCHCGAVRFEVEANLEAGTVRCNCSICAKTRFWLAFVPAGRFRLLQGEEHLADYRFGTGRIQHRFCARCGVKPFGQATDGQGVAINVAAWTGLRPSAWLCCQ
jgi:Uncharacterized conserved protein